MYDNLYEILRKFIPNNNIDILYVASSSIAKYFNEKFDILLIDSLIEIMHNKTIIMPTFSFDFCDIGEYSVLNSKTFCGGISSKFLKYKGVKRSLYSPMHNVAILGRLQKYLLSKEYSTSFGVNSIFEDFNNFKVGILLVDCSFDDGIPFVHCLEEKYKCSYRTYKDYVGYIVDENNKRIYYTFKRYIRKKGTVLSAESLGKEFYRTEYVKNCNYEMSTFTYFSLQDFYTHFNPIFAKNPDIMEVINGKNKVSI